MSSPRPYQYQSFPKTQLENLYLVEKKTQDEIAVLLGTTQKIIWRALHYYGIPTRVAAKRDQRGPKNHMWRADATTLHYATQHHRVEVARGKPELCEVCGESGSKTKYNWANLTGRYEDIHDYQRMCKSCHVRYDSARGLWSNKLSAPEVLAIRRDYAVKNGTVEEIATRYKRNLSSVHRLVKRDYYKWVPEEQHS